MCGASLQVLGYRHPSMLTRDTATCNALTDLVGFRTFSYQTFRTYTPALRMLAERVLGMRIPRGGDTLVSRTERDQRAPVYLRHSKS
jgi:hypothetical protein